jgi:hypothetical protein
MTESDVTQRGMINSLYGETLIENKHRRWLRGHWVNTPSAVPIPRGLLEGLQDGVKKRHSVGYLNENFASWTLALGQNPGLQLPTANFIFSTTTNSTKTEMLYDHGGFRWFSDWRSFVRYNGPITERVFVIRFPNDGFFYVEKNMSDPDVNESDVANYRHQKTCYDGWFLLGDSAWQDLAPISAFMEAWLGSTNIEKEIVYHADANRVDICVRCLTRLLSFEFSFEQRHPKVIRKGFW